MHVLFMLWLLHLLCGWVITIITKIRIQGIWWWRVMMITSNGSGCGNYCGATTTYCVNTPSSISPVTTLLAVVSRATFSTIAKTNTFWRRWWRGATTTIARAHCIVCVTWVVGDTSATTAAGTVKLDLLFVLVQLGNLHLLGWWIFRKIAKIFTQGVTRRVFITSIIVG